MTTTTETREAFGLPVTGEFTPPYTSRVEQQDPQNLKEILDAVLADERVEGVRWEQYTPYFNDGEPCEFNIYEARVKFVGADEEAGEYEDGFVSSWDVGYDDNLKDREDAQELKELVEKISRAVASGAHYDFLLKTFGDHAIVTATSEGFNVEFYDHD